MTDRIAHALRAEFPANLTIYTEFMDTARTQRDEAMHEATRMLALKYAGKKLDIVFTLGSAALEVLIGEHDRLFANTPIVFAGVRQSSPLLSQLPNGFSGVTTPLDLARTLDLAVALQPDLQQIVLVTGASEVDRAWRDRALADLRQYPRQFVVEDIAALPIDDVVKAVAQAPPHSAIIYLSIFMDGAGNTFMPADLTTRIAGAASAPVYGVYPTSLGKGIVGGYVATFEATGDVAAALALPILRGEKAAEAARVLDVAAAYQVDHRAMQEWRLDEARLPPGTQVLFKDLPAWAAYWPTILIASGVIVAQSIAILAFWIQKRRRQQAEQSLRQVNEHLDVAASTANLGLWSWRPGDDRIWMTPHCRRMLRIAEHEDFPTLDVFLASLAGHRQKAIRDSMIEAVRTNSVFQREIRTTDDSGQKTWLLAAGKCIRHGHDLIVAGTLLDVSERKMAQIDAEEQRRQLVHLTRVGVLAELSGALAHELNQPLTAILSNAQAAQRLVARTSPDMVELREILADIVEDDYRAGEVLGKLRAMIRKEDAQYISLDLNQVVEDVLHLVHSDLIERKISVDTELDKGLPPVCADRVQIQQVLLNLVRNSCDAMGGAPRQPHQLVLATKRHGNASVALTVADNGGGVHENVQQRLFEPFVTTKPQGLGLGLAISRSILTAHGGKIWCDNNANGGAVFGFSLPVFEGSVGWTT